MLVILSPAETAGIFTYIMVSYLSCYGMHTYLELSFTFIITLKIMVVIKATAKFYCLMC